MNKGLIYQVVDCDSPCCGVVALYFKKITCDAVAMTCFFIRCTD